VTSPFHGQEEEERFVGPYPCASLCSQQNRSCEHHADLPHLIRTSALPAVSRGFATSSIPKTKKALELEAEQAAKVAADEAEAAATATTASSGGANGAGGAGGGPGAEGGGEGEPGQGKANGDVEEDWEKEGGYLQGLVERLQDKVEKEVARGIKVSPVLILFGGEEEGKLDADWVSPS
jgi:hypothetical protein